MIKRNYFAEHKAIITFPSAFLFAFLLGLPAQAIVPYSGPVGLVATGAVTFISLGETIATIALFICIPVALGGFLLRLLGFQKEGEGNGWHWNIKQATVKSFRYFTYHFILLGGLVLIAKILQSTTECNYFPAYCYTSRPFSFLTGSIADNIFNLIYILLFPTILAILWTYLSYKNRKTLNPVVISPSVGSYIRLISWNFLIIFIAALFF